MNTISFCCWCRFSACILYELIIIITITITCNDSDLSSLSSKLKSNFITFRFQNFTFVRGPKTYDFPTSYQNFFPKSIAVSTFAMLPNQTLAFSFVPKVRIKLLTSEEAHFKQLQVLYYFLLFFQTSKL